MGTYLTADQLVDVALAALAMGELMTIHSMVDLEPWIALEAARLKFMKAALSGQVAPRYQVASARSGFPLETARSAPAPRDRSTKITDEAWSPRLGGPNLRAA